MIIQCEEHQKEALNNVVSTKRESEVVFKLSLTGEQMGTR